MQSGRIVIEGYGKKDTVFFKVLAASFVAGVLVAGVVYWLWRSQLISAQFQELFNVVALVVCPPYILSVISGPALNNAFAIVLTAGTIVFANGFLYAGVISGVYFLLQVRQRRRQH